MDKITLKEMEKYKIYINQDVFDTFDTEKEKAQYILWSLVEKLHKDKKLRWIFEFDMEDMYKLTEDISTNGIIEMAKRIEAQK